VGSMTATGGSPPGRARLVLLRRRLVIQCDRKPAPLLL
jgi:hypothetical protein